ncbi:bacteriocin-processing peptidase. Cysteine peptidase. MEROPS family C39 [Tenacibaculum sp. MAR_2010_89]|uniref:peptidase domain-containing ABC transporter n=1 Tax=Tenacibaculum sp. MAR_2010_89 TaxID=1250198 RepID=UPI000894C9C9|nr:peptidase domain-containing ABC transporter [Tenacibaculum sp. MAR_2010_89]SED92541.1 bacteriocin-processing peptidase. Cysteine peptidase. MEROPS family C39 [Tenacibaculum sp. MAR_2010_89]
MRRENKNMNLKKLQKTHVLQHDQSDCGVACLLSLIQYYGGSNSLEKLRELSGTTKQGTTLLGLYQTANQLGFTAQGNEADIQALIVHKEPVILHVLIENKLQHYIVCYGFENNKFIIGDPGKGILTYTKDELEKVWISKTCLTLGPNTNFVKAIDTKKSKKEWFLKLLKEDRQLLLISILLGIGIALLGMAMSVFSQKLIDDILPSQNTKKLFFGIGLLTFLLLVRVGFTALREVLLIRQSKDFNNRIIDSFYTSLLHLPKPFFDTRKIGELVARLNDTNRVQKVIKFIASNFVIDALVVLVSFVFLFSYSWQVGVISLISLPIYFLIIYRFNAKIIKSQKEVMQSYALSESNYISSMQGIATVKNFNRQSFFQKINQLVFGNLQNKIADLGKINVRLSLLAGIAGVLFLMSILSYTSYQVYHKQMLLGELMAILGIAGSLLPSITNLALVSIPINEAKIAFNRMFEFTSIEKEEQGGIEIESFDLLAIKNLSFRFAGRSQLLKDLDLIIKKGKITAVVGESGSGKSTLGQILQKFYSFEGGTITINNKVSFKEINVSYWRDLVGVVPQEITIFNGNVLDNILLGKEDKPEDVMRFCQEHGFEEFIKYFPQGYATILGEEGVNLSGGQKQIIALARVLYKQPQLLILDEATAAMDRKTEKFSIELISQLKDKMGILFISHRLETLKKYADTIYVLENGETSINGNHQKLLETSNFYSDYWQELL